MPSPIEQNRILHYVGIIVAFIPQLFAAPVAATLRAFHLGVGHSHVSAAAIVSFTILVGWWSWTGMVYVLNSPREEANVAKIQEDIARIQADRVYKELLIAEKQATVQAVPVGPWSMMSPTIDASGVTIVAKIHQLADALTFQWITRREEGSTQQFSGQKTIDVTGDRGSDATLVINALEFGPAWVTGTRMTYHATQVLADGREQRFTGTRVLLVVP